MTTTKTIRHLMRLSPAAVLLFALMGNTANSCGEIEPLEPFCQAAVDCEGLPHMACSGHWSCDAGECLYQCQTQVVSECTKDADCGFGQVCEIVDCVAPDCDDMGPCPLSCMVVGECVDEELPPPPPPVEVCDSDADCGPNQFCAMECPMEACPFGADGCFVECSGTCQDSDEPPFCFDDGECPDGFVCDFSAEVYCGQFNGDVPGREGGAPRYCGGICVESPACKVEACPEGTFFDDEACVCLPDATFCYDDSDCPAGSHCEMDEDVWCLGADQGDAEAPMWCGGTCVADPTCIGLICPVGLELDPTTCACVPPQNTCLISGCSGQVCASQPVDTTCEWLPYYECFAPSVTSCGPYGPGGACMWEPTAALFQCLDNHF